MKSWDFTSKKFLSLQEKQQHKKASELLHDILDFRNPSWQNTYRKIEEWLQLPAIDLTDPEAIANRFHFHLEKAGKSSREASFLQIRTQDKESSTAFLNVHIVLCSLRSAFNVGSIFRTVEAFRLGTIYCLGTTPLPSQSKVQKTSMGTWDKVPWHHITDLTLMPRPWIALETTSHSSSIFTYKFPDSFTLFLGNEEFGLPRELLLSCDTLLEIPLQGSKNSLNVASALAITGSWIRAGNSLSI